MSPIYNSKTSHFCCLCLNIYVNFSTEYSLFNQMQLMSGVCFLSEMLFAMGKMALNLERMQTESQAVVLVVLQSLLPLLNAKFLV